MTIPLSVSGKDAIEIAALAAKEAGEILKSNFRQGTEVHYKGRANIVTDVDFKADDCIKSILLKEYPDHNILSEESEPPNSIAEYTWILDPLDGTNNYSFGIPFFCVVIALTKGNDVVLSTIFDPLQNELFSAQKGKGAFLNNKPISVTSKTKVKESLIGLDVGYVAENGKWLLQFITDLWPEAYAFRLMGSAALGMAYAACGRLDLYFHRLLYPWELACGQLLVTEAGGVATDWEGRPLGAGENSVIVSNKAIHNEFLQIIKAR